MQSSSFARKRWMQTLFPSLPHHTWALPLTGRIITSSQWGEMFMFRTPWRPGFMMGDFLKCPPNGVFPCTALSAWKRCRYFIGSEMVSLRYLCSHQHLRQDHCSVCGGALPLARLWCAVWGFPLFLKVSRLLNPTVTAHLSLNWYGIFGKWSGGTYPL